jgi:hypothetical protein
MRLVTGASLALSAVSCLVVVGVLVYSMARVPWPLRLAGIAALLVVFGVSELVLWIAVTPPVLRADAVEVSSSSRLDRQRMQRSDVAFIFRGQVTGKGRTRGVWYKSYIFAAADGKVGMSFGALMFTPDDMAQFAQRLQVPIKGDFSVQVKDRIDLATA